MIRPTAALLGTIALLAACSGGDGRSAGQDSALPPEAFGMFENTNDPAFQKRLDMTANAVTYSMRVTLAGARGGPLICRGEVPGGIRSNMRLDLDCAGTSIPFRLEYRGAEADWILTEEDAAPEIFTRLRN